MSETEAPWGLKADGTPYKRNPAAAKAAWAKRRAGEAGGQKAPGKKGRPNTKASPERTEARARAVAELIGIPAAACAAMAQVTQAQPEVSLPYLADAIVLDANSPAISEAVAGVAAEDERIAAVIDKIVDTGPYAALFLATAPVVAQIAANHVPGLSLLARVFGGGTREEVLAQYDGPQDAGGGEDA